MPRSWLATASSRQHRSRPPRPRERRVEVIRSWTIRAALTAALIAGLALPAVVASWYTISRQRQLLTRQLEGYHLRVAQVLALGMEQPLWTMVPDLGRPLLASVMEDERVIRVRVTGDQGVFLEQELAQRRTAGSWTTSRPVVVQGDEIGEVLVEIGTGQMEELLTAQKRHLLVVVLLQLGLSLAIILVIIHCRVLEPLRRLVRQSEQLARGDLHEPFVWSSTDELGQVGRSFEHSRRSLLHLVTTLNQQNDELSRLNLGLRDALAARSVFLANMSHELRTPLNSILGFAGILDRKMPTQLDDRHARFLKNILSSGRRLLRLIDDVLDLAKIDAGRLEVYPEEVDVGELLHGLGEIIAAAAEEQQVPVTVQVAGDLPPLTADPARLKQIVFQLLANAVKFSNPGAEVVVRAGPIGPDDPPLHRGGVRIDVIDHGIGISEQDLQIIFDEFRQVDGSASRRYEGTGLGLALVQRLLEVINGRVEVDSTPGRGSTFSVFVPHCEPGSSPQ